MRQHVSISISLAFRPPSHAFFFSFLLLMRHCFLFCRTVPLASTLLSSRLFFLLCCAILFLPRSPICHSLSHLTAAFIPGLTHAHVQPPPPTTVSVIIHRQLTLLRYCLEDHASTDRQGQHLILKNFAVHNVHGTPFIFNTLDLILHSL